MAKRSPHSALYSGGGGADALGELHEQMPVAIVEASPMKIIGVCGSSR
jgi:hypothetical protein